MAAEPSHGESGWEEIAQRLLEREAEEHLFELEDALGDVTRGLREDGDVDVEDLTELRMAVQDFEDYIEEDLAPVVDGAEPWEQAARNVPLSRLVDVVEGTPYRGDEADE